MTSCALSEAWGDAQMMHDGWIALKLSVTAISKPRRKD